MLGSRMFAAKANYPDVSDDRRPRPDSTAGHSAASGTGVSLPTPMLIKVINPNTTGR